MAFALLSQRRRDLLWCVLIPLLTLVAWPLFNVVDYGGVHILGPQVEGRRAAALLAMGLTCAVCLGGIMPASLPYPTRSLRLANRLPSLAPLGWILLVACAALIGSAFRGWLPPEQVDTGLALVFLCNGLMIALSLCLTFKRDLAQPADWSTTRET